MPILTNVEIRSFKSILSQKIDLGQLNVFIGPNGAGKSNFLEALGMLSSAISGEIEYSKFIERGMRLSSPEVFRSAFKNVDRKPTISLEGHFSDLSYHVNVCATESLSNPWRYFSEEITRGTGKIRIAGRSNRGARVDGHSIKEPSPQQSIVTTAEALGALSNDELFKIRSLKSFGIYAPSTPILRGASTDNSTRSPLGLYGGGLTEALSDVLNDEKLREELQSFFKLMDWFKTIGIKTPSSTLQSRHVHTTNRVVMYMDKYMKTNFNVLYAYDVSEGALFILFVIILLVHKQAPNIFALDNIDNCLNPALITALMRHVVDILSKNPNKQIFLTTHNPTTLDSIDLFNNNHRLYVVKRGDSGGTIFERVEPPKGCTKEEWDSTYCGMRLSEIWLSGAIGGIPMEGF